MTDGPKKPLFHTQTFLSMKYQLTAPFFAQMTDAQYRDLQAWNNSALRNCYNALRGITVEKRPEKVFNFGQAFHTMILEPEKWDLANWKLQPNEIRTLEAMKNQIEKTENMRFFLSNGRREIVAGWRDPVTGLNCKGKFDLLTSNGEYLVDIKSTGARDRKEFLEHCEKYNYDRQAAFYLDGCRRDRFAFFGFQKRAPYEIFYFETDRTKPFFQRGEKRYKFLLQKAAEKRWFTPDAMYQSLNPIQSVAA